MGQALEDIFAFRNVFFMDCRSINDCVARSGPASVSDIGGATTAGSCIEDFMEHEFEPGGNISDERRLEKERIPLEPLPLIISSSISWMKLVLI